jgi:hypothetical protein
METTRFIRIDGTYKDVPITGNINKTIVANTGIPLLELTNVTIGTTVTGLAAGVFTLCTSLVSVTIPDTVTNINTTAFKNCTSLTSVTIGIGVKSIGTSTFENCTSLSSLIIPNSVTSIGDYAFYNCTGLSSLIIPDSINIIGQYAFSQSGLTSVTFGTGISGIVQYTFKSCSKLASVTFGTGVKSIGDASFESCTSLTSIRLSTKITFIGQNAFLSCTSLTSVTIPSSITTIGQYAFKNCTSLASLTIPSTITIFKPGVFTSCTSLATVIFNGPYTNITSSPDVFSNIAPNATRKFYWFNTANSSQIHGGLLFEIQKTTVNSTPSSAGPQIFFEATKGTPTIIGFSISTTTFGNTFTITPPDSDSLGLFSYTSSNLEVATISGTTITVVGVGNATITATQAETTTYKSGTTSTSFQVNQATPTISGFSIPTKTVIDDPFQITQPTSNSLGLFSYISSNLEVATISGTTITVVGVGNATITATQAETTTYKSGTSDAFFQVNQATPTPTITNFSIPIKTFGISPFTITQPTSNSSGLISYTSSNLEVATISGTTITVVGVGNATITATQAETTTYKSGTRDALFQVIENTFSNPADISRGLELHYFLTTNAEYGGITNNLIVTSDLINTGETQKTLINMTNDVIYITKL